MADSLSSSVEPLSSRKLESSMKVSSLPSGSLVFDCSATMICCWIFVMRSWATLAHQTLPCVEPASEEVSFFFGDPQGCWGVQNDVIFLVLSVF